MQDKPHDNPLCPTPETKQPLYLPSPSNSLDTTMSPASEPSQFSCPPTCYVITPSIVLQIVVLAIRSLLSRILKCMINFVHAIIQKLIAVVVKRQDTQSIVCDNEIGSEGEGLAGLGAGIESGPETWTGVKRLGGITLTITVLIGEIRLFVLTVTIVALTFWVPFYPSSARSLFNLCGQFCRTKSTTGGRTGFAIDIRMGS